MLAGPVTGWIEPDALLGDLLFPLVGVSVGIILAEGGLSLRFSELKTTGHVVRNLVSIGALITWAIAAAAAHWLLGFDLPLALLLGAILVVSGPTVVGPLLREVRPTSRVSAILKWEGIVIDPVGATLTLLVFEAIRAGELQHSVVVVAGGILRTILVGGLLGGIAAGIIVVLFRHYWVPDFLQNPVALMLVVGAYVGANLLQGESGLLAVTVLGVLLANQKRISIAHIVEFKENLRVLLISALFILLAARLRVADIAELLTLRSALFLLALVLIARPAAVLAATAGSALTWRERGLLMWVAPRGIVAAAVSSVFALRLADAGYPGADQLVAATFLVIIATVALYGLTARPVARWLKVSQANPQGVLFVGASPWAREIAGAVQAAGFRVLLVDTNWGNVSAARAQGVPAHYGSILADSEDDLDQPELSGIGRLMALTSNDELNALACQHYRELFGRADVYQLCPGGDACEGAMPANQRGRLLFGQPTTFNELVQKFAAGARVETTRLTKESDYNAFQMHYQQQAVPMFLITQAGELMAFATDSRLRPQPGQSLISLVPATQPPLNSLPER